MFCPSCGCKVPEGTKFCEQCGMPFKEAFDEESAVQDRASQAMQKIKSFISNLELSQSEQITSLVAAVTALFTLICINGTLISWFAAIAGLLLTYFCVKKIRYDTKAMAIAFSIFAARFFWIDCSNVISGSIRYYSAITFLIRAVIYGCAVIYWLTVCGIFHKKELGSSILLLGIGITSLYALIEMVAAFEYGFRSVLFDLAWAGFYAVFAIEIVNDGNTVTYIKTLLEGGTNLHRPPQAFAQYCPRCGVGHPADALFCDNCGASLAQENGALEQIDDPMNSYDVPVSKSLICPQCGAVLEEGSIFCDSCGVRVV